MGETQEEVEEEEEKLEDEGDMEVLDEAKEEEDEEEEESKEEESKADDEDSKTKEEEFTLDMPDDVEGISEDAVDVTFKAMTALNREKVAVSKYTEAIRRAYEIIAALYPDESRESADVSFSILKEFDEKIKDSTRVKLSEETKKAFAYHVEVCKSAMPQLFKDPKSTEKKVEIEESEVTKLF